MIANNHTEELVTMQTQHHDNDQPDQSYITVSSIFSRIQSYEKPNTNLSVSSEGQTSLNTMRMSFFVAPRLFRLPMNWLPSAL